MSAGSMKILNNFLSYAKKMGLELLQEDRKFIGYISTTVSEKSLREALNQYLRDWKHGSEMEESEIKKMNAGRRLANTKFRERFGFNYNK